jgi:mannose-6-phosphate isomerase-like protein (cupin superfamily)
VVPFRRVSETVIPFLSRRRERALVGQKLPHAIGAVALFADGILRAQRETQPYGWVLAGAEILVSVLVLAGIVRGVLKAASAPVEQHAPPLIDYVDLLLAAMLTVEAFAHHYETAHWPRPTLLTAATMLMVAMFHGPLTVLARRRRGLVMSNKGLSVGHPLRRFNADWSELKSIVVTERAAVLETVHGVTHRIDLSDLGNETQVRDALREAEILRTAKRRFTPKTPAPVDPSQTLMLRPVPTKTAWSPPVPADVTRVSKPPTLIDRPTVIQAAGNKPKKIEEYAGRVNSGHGTVSVARMQSPEGWVEPGQQPDFEEITLVLKGILRVEYRGGSLNVHAGQAVVSHPGEWIRYSSPEPGGAEYVAICLPAFSPDTVHRDPQ